MQFFPLPCLAPLWTWNPSRFVYLGGLAPISSLVTAVDSTFGVRRGRLYGGMRKMKPNVANWGCEEFGMNFFVIWVAQRKRWAWRGAFVDSWVTHHKWIHALLWISTVCSPSWVSWIPVLLTFNSKFKHFLVTILAVRAFHNHMYIQCRKSFFSTLEIFTTSTSMPLLRLITTETSFYRRKWCSFRLFLEGVRSGYFLSVTYVATYIRGFRALNLGI